MAERILVDGHADLVGMARAHFADGRLLAKARDGRGDEIRPCVGGNECISRRVTEGVRFSCAVNPSTGRENRTAPAPSARRRILVVGGGPAGLETAALCAERGHDVELWEARDLLGGQLAVAAHAPAYTDYALYLAWQEGRVRRAGVRVVLKQSATADTVTAYGADTVVVATGGRPRRPGIPAEDQSFVYIPRTKSLRRT